MSEYAVAHLVRRGNPEDAFHRFLDSYHRHPAGRAHALLLILKGFGGEIPSFISAGMAGVAHEIVHVGDEGFDIGAYDRAIRATDHEHYLLLNSFSEILADHWLEIMAGHLAADVGAVGATASCESVLGADAVPPTAPPPLIWWMRSAWRRARRAAPLWRRFAPFPNPHLRTNALLLRRETWLRLTLPPLKTKKDANAFEAGRQGFTRQIEAMDLRVLIAGRDGRAYAAAEWPMSRTFRAGGQANLLVADNRTRHFAAASLDEQRRLAQMTWGDARA